MMLRVLLLRLLLASEWVLVRPVPAQILVRQARVRWVTVV